MILGSNFLSYKRAEKARNQDIFPILADFLPISKSEIYYF